jgi:GNAT superfamily N-acetyltransferase
VLWLQNRAKEDSIMTAGMECVIRAAAPADRGVIAAFAAELASHVRDPDPQLSAEYLDAQLFCADPWAQCRVAEQRGLIIGFVTYCKQVEIHTARRWLWIGDLYVAQGARRRGVARHLIADLQSRARELGCAGLRLDLFRANVEGSSFYRKLGARMDENLALVLPGSTHHN